MADKEINPVLIIVVIILAVLFFRFSPLSVIFGSPWGSYSVSPDAEGFVQYFGNARDGNQQNPLSNGYLPVRPCNGQCPTWLDFGEAENPVNNECSSGITHNFASDVSLTTLNHVFSITATNARRPTDMVGVTCG